jgi:hypothetical protein
MLTDFSEPLKSSNTDDCVQTHISLDSTAVKKTSTAVEFNSDCSISNSRANVFGQF